MDSLDIKTAVYGRTRAVLPHTEGGKPKARTLRVCVTMNRVNTCSSDATQAFTEQYNNHTIFSIVTVRRNIITAQICSPHTVKFPVEELCVVTIGLTSG